MISLYVRGEAENWWWYHTEHHQGIICYKSRHHSNGINIDIALEHYPYIAPRGLCVQSTILRYQCRPIWSHIDISATCDLWWPHMFSRTYSMQGHGETDSTIWWPVINSALGRAGQMKESNTDIHVNKLLALKWRPFWQPSWIVTIGNHSGNNWCAQIDSSTLIT